MNNIRFIYPFLLIVFSCTTSEVKNEELINIITEYSEENLQKVNFLTKRVNSFKTKLSNSKQDRYFAKVATELEPIFIKATKISNDLDDYIVSKMNQLIKESQGAELYFTKDAVSGVTKYEPLKGILNKASTSLLYDSDLENQLIDRIKKYRDKVILTCWGSWRGEVQFKMDEYDLHNSSSLERHLENHPIKDQVLTIYNMFDLQDKAETEITENNKKTIDLKNKSLIEIIATLSKIRKQIKTTETIIIDFLNPYLYMPPVITKINKVEALAFSKSDIIKQGTDQMMFIAPVMYDTNQVYPISYRYNNKEEYKKINKSKLKLDTKSPGKKTIEGDMFIEIGGWMSTRHWSYNYTVVE